MKMTVSRDKPVAADAVVVLAGRGMLEMDLGQALAEAGFTMMQGFPRGGLAQALIVDTEALDRRSSAMVRRHAKAGVPVMMITDDESAALRITGLKTACFRKPLVSDVVIATMKRLLAAG